MVRGMKQFHNEALHNFMSSPDIISVVKSRKMLWVRHAACMGEDKFTTLIEQLDEKKQIGKC
jgi:hypothetical protein